MNLLQIKKKILKSKKPVYYSIDKLKYNLTDFNFSNKLIIKESNMKKVRFV